VLSKYFQKERWARILETKAVAIAAAGNAKVAGEMIQDLAEILIPELDQDRNGFRERAAKLMPIWDTNVLAIERDSNGRPGIKRYNVSDVEEELREFAEIANKRIAKAASGRRPTKRTRSESPPSFRKQR
jgi:hypothetical protein